MRLEQVLKCAPWEETEMCFRRDYCGERRMDGPDDDAFVQLHKGVYRQLCDMKAEPNECVIHIDTLDADGHAVPVDPAVEDKNEIFFHVWGSMPGTDATWGLSLTRWKNGWEWQWQQPYYSASRLLKSSPTPSGK